MKNYKTPKFDMINVLSSDIITNSPGALTAGEPTNEMNIDYGDFGLN